jgi:hypothetical protein
MSKAGKQKDQLQQKSPAEFFAENKNIAGFDNVSRVYRSHRVLYYRSKQVGRCSLASVSTQPSGSW